MPTSLAQPNGAQVLANFPRESGAVSALGTMSAAVIDAMVAANPLTNPLRTAFNAIKRVVTDWAALPDERYPFAYRALIAASIYELLAIDMAGRAAIPNTEGGGLEITAYTSKMQYFADQAGLELRQLGITSSDYYTFTSASAERIGARELNHTFNDDNIYGTHC